MENQEASISTTPPISPSVTPSSRYVRVALYTSLLICILAISGIVFYLYRHRTATPSSVATTEIPLSSSPIPFQKPLVDVPFVRQEITINQDIAAPFDISEIKNIPDMEKAYGFTFTPEDLKKLSENKFVIKNLLDTNLKDKVNVSNDTMREFLALYLQVAGSDDYKLRTQANSVFISSDLFYNLFSILSAELLKETENKYLYTDTLTISKMMYEEASKKYDAATGGEKHDWMKIRDYFAIPYALLSTAEKPITAEDYWNSQNKYSSMDEMQADFDKKDVNFDSLENASAFIKNLHLTQDEEGAVLQDLGQVYAANNARGYPIIFTEELTPKNKEDDITVQIPFTLFKPRGTYTSSSLRRQYFRAVQWYQQIPFLLSNPDLTRYSVEIGEMFGANEELDKSYESLSSLIAFVVGESDDLDVSDLIAATKDLGQEKSLDIKALTSYLVARKPGPKIKALPVQIGSAVSVQDELDATRGMRFMSQKFIPDSYWTSKLTQGDEAGDVHGLSLPDKASSLEVLSILGSPYATSKLSDLPFYSEKKEAIDTRLLELTKESNAWNDDYWKSNLYTSTLWTLRGMFSWLDTNRSKLPSFMQSPLWNSKTLLTAGGFWTELRHTSLLYAKQSFAEKGGGGDDMCDQRVIPPPAKGYIEPQAESYDRLLYTATRLQEEYKARGFELDNLSRVSNFIDALNSARDYTKLELENTALVEGTTTKTRHSYDDDNNNCVENFISDDSHVARSGAVSPWEDMRYTLLSKLHLALPIPIEGPILPIKDKRAAVVADIHTDMNGGVLEEGTGVPRLIFVAVKDTNGPRLTVGFTYSQYETISSSRLTDETWQDNFYTDGGDYVITYKPKEMWPDTNTWFQELLGKK